MAVDYASMLGITSFAVPIVFASLYLLLLIYFFTKAVSRPVCIYLTLFCAVRTAAFILRTLLASVQSYAESLHVFIAYEILYNAGFSALLFSTNMLVTARTPLADGRISCFLRLPLLFPVALLASIALVITSTIMSGLGTTLSTLNTGNTLRKVVIYVFLGCSSLVFLRTWFLPPVKLSRSVHHAFPSRIGYDHYVYILLTISILLLVREVFFTITANNTPKQNNEALWYPFSVVTEFIAVVLSATPGLVPDAPRGDQRTWFPLT